MHVGQINEDVTRFGVEFKVRACSLLEESGVRVYARASVCTYAMVTVTVTVYVYAWLLPQGGHVLQLG